MDFRLIDDYEISFQHNSRLLEEKNFQDSIEFLNFSVQTDSHKQEQKQEQIDTNQLKTSLPLTDTSKQMEMQDFDSNNMGVTFSWDFFSNLKEQLLSTDHMPVIQQTIPPLNLVVQTQQDLMLSQFLSQNIVQESLQIYQISQSQLQNNSSIKILQPSSQDQQTSCTLSRKLKNKAQSGKGTRKGKKIQSKTQKFIKFMTRFYFNKNFNQYFNKKLKDQQISTEVYQSYSVEKKVQIIDAVIEGLEMYEMRIHYSVKNGSFFKGFSEEEKEHIQELFWRVVRRAYQIKLQTNKRRLTDQQILNRNLEIGKFLDREGQEQFETAFDQILHSHPNCRSLVNCSFEKRLWKQLQK